MPNPIKYIELKPKVAVAVTTVGAISLQNLTTGGINPIASHAVKNPTTTLGLETGMIATIIIDPKTQKKCRHQEAVDNGGGREIKHRTVESLKRKTGQAQAASHPPAFPAQKNAVPQWRNGVEIERKKAA